MALINEWRPGKVDGHEMGSQDTFMTKGAINKNIDKNLIKWGNKAAEFDVRLEKTQ